VLIFFTLLAKLIPLYILILLGFLAGKYFKVQKESIAPLVIYIVAPVIFFNAAATTPISPAVISLPIVTFFMALIIMIFSYKIGKLFWRDGTANLFGFVSSMGNTGYFGLPVAIAVLPKEFIDPYLVSLIGISLVDASGGYYIMARGKHTVRDSIMHVLKLPALYAFFIGITLQLIHTPFGTEYTNLIINFKGAYVILGMMLVGLGIASMPSVSFDKTFLLFTFISKFLIWPALAFLLIFIDVNFLHFYSEGMHHILLLLSIVPVAANTVAYSTQFNIHPHKAALAVLLSTLFALLYIPIFVTLFVK